MGEGSKKISKSLLSLEPTSIVDLFLLYPNFSKEPDVYFPFHGGINIEKGLIWQGVTYLPIGIELDSFEKNSDGSVDRPKIKFSNKDYFITHLLRKYDDFSNARLIRKRTFVEFLDDLNFDGGNPFGSPDSQAEIINEEYVVSQKIQETKDYVEFELTSPIDLDNKNINNRKIYGKYCFWSYRGEGCEYVGKPIQKDSGESFKDVEGSPLVVRSDAGFSYGNLRDVYRDDKWYNPGDVTFKVNNSVTIFDPNNIDKPRPLITYYVAKERVRGEDPDSTPQSWDRDGCNKKISSCKLRFSETNTFERFLGVKTENRKVAQFTRPDGNDKFKLIPRTVANNVVVTDGTEENSTQDITNYLQQGWWTIAINLQYISNGPAGASILSTSSSNKNGMFDLILDKGSITLQLYFTDGTIFSSTITVGKFPLRNYPIILRRRGTNIFEIYNPTTKKTKTIWLGGRGEILNTPNAFNIGYSAGFSSYLTKSPKMNIYSIQMWSQLKYGPYFDTFYLGDINNGGSVPPLYDEAKRGGEKHLLAWWELTESNIESELKIPNLLSSLDISDLYFLNIENANDVFKILSKNHSYNETKVVSTSETRKSLPFGGFPGTDGFDFGKGI